MSDTQVIDTEPMIEVVVEKTEDKLDTCDRVKTYLVVSCEDCLDLLRTCLCRMKTYTIRF